MLGLDDNGISRRYAVVQQIQAKTGYTPSAFALAAYDAFRVAASAYIAIGGTDDFPALRSAFVGSANNYYGATGWTALNSNGDRQNVTIDFWRVVKTQPGYSWRKSAAYVVSTNTLTRYF
jgi:ABC-type branched-subunit amino acid transport system substrate-binding protein